MNGSTDRRQTGKEGGWKHRQKTGKEGGWKRVRWATARSVRVRTQRMTICAGT